MIDSSSSSEEEEEEEEKLKDQYDSEFEVDIETSDNEYDSKDESSDDEPLILHISRSSKAVTKTKRAGMLIDSSDDEEEEDDQEEMVEVFIKPKPTRGATKKSKNNVPDYSSSVEKILAIKRGIKGAKEVRVKLVGQSYRNAVWLPCSTLIDAGRGPLLRNFEKRSENEEADPDLEDGIHPSWLVIDRVIGYDKQSSSYLVKWKDLGYADATWEDASALTKSKEDAAAVKRYHDRTKAAEARFLAKPTMKGFNPNAVPDFCNGRTLRPYQIESLAWMAKHWRSRQNCILGDEMGLGKTAQSISVMAFQRQFGGVQGPFLVIAPLTTLGHWQREIETWTDMDCIVYAGSAADREMAEKWDLWVDAKVKSKNLKSDGTGRGRRGSQTGSRTVTRRILKPHVVLTSYETILRAANLFRSIEWETVIIDEAHRMKSKTSSTREVISSLDIRWLLLLTGTPVQNNMCELFGLLNLLDPIEFSSQEGFLQKYGNEKTCTPEQIKALQSALKPLLLRRMKEDVETLPEKEECIIWTQLTIEQRGYYKAIFEGQIGALMAGAKPKNLPNLRNLAMELRKVCCHPFLCNGLEDDMKARRRQIGKKLDEVDALVGASGKMLLLHKLLPKLRAEGHKVLIFSQFKTMLDVLEDYLNAVGMPLERIDGSTSSRDRQAAIDRFSRHDKNDSDSFIFLLSTKAGGQGITLTAADTCIIYDSDWNPQNDLQAMARCHRIGQEKDVTIYRLVSKDTYEEHVFRTSSRKYGLDEAILGGIGAGTGKGLGSGTGGDPEADGHKIAQLLKHGAHCLDKMEEAAAETEAFAAEDIDEILKGRTEKRAIGGRAGNTFSIATFEVPDLPENDKDFWTTLLPEAAAREEEQRKATAAGVVELAPRRRKRINYSEFDRQNNRKKDKNSGAKRTRYQDDDDYEFELGGEEAAHDSDSDYTGDGNLEKEAMDEDNGNNVNDLVNKKRFSKEDAPNAGKSNKAAGGKAINGMKVWSLNDVTTLLDCMLRFGNIEENPHPIIKECGLKQKGFKEEEIIDVMTALLVQIRRAKGPPGEAPIQDFNPRSFQQEKDRQRELLYPKFFKGEINYDDLEDQAEREAKSVIDYMKSKKERSIAATITAIKENPAEFPSAADRALRDPKLAERLVRHHTKYQKHLRERSVLREWWRCVMGLDYEEEGANLAIQRITWRYGKNLPSWWTCEDTKELFHACYVLGWGAGRKGQVDVEKMLTSKSFNLCKIVQQRGPGMPLPMPSLTDKEETFPIVLEECLWVDLKDALSRFIRAGLDRLDEMLHDALQIKILFSTADAEEEARPEKTIQVSSKPRPSTQPQPGNGLATTKTKEGGAAATKDKDDCKVSTSDTKNKQGDCMPRLEINNESNPGEEGVKNNAAQEVNENDKFMPQKENKDESSIMCYSDNDASFEVIEVSEDEREEEEEDQVEGKRKEKAIETKTPGSSCQPALKVFGSYTNPLSGVPPEDATKGDVKSEATLKKTTKQHKQYSLFEMSLVQKNWQRFDRVGNQSNESNAKTT